MIESGETSTLPIELSHPALSPSSLKRLLWNIWWLPSSCCFGAASSISQCEKMVPPMSSVVSRSPRVCDPCACNGIDELCWGEKEGHPVAHGMLTGQELHVGLWITAWHSRQSPFGASWGRQALILLSSSKTPSDNPWVLVISGRGTGAFSMSMQKERSHLRNGGTHSVTLTAKL